MTVSSSFTVTIVLLFLSAHITSALSLEIPRRKVITTIPAAVTASPILLKPKPSHASSENSLLAGGDRVPLKTDSPKNGFPLASFGLQIYDDATAYKLTLTALEVGYRNFFASVLARNQRGFARAIRDSAVPREDIYICGTVLSNNVRGFDAAYKKTQKGCMENMEAFGVGGIDHIDMIMLDYPGPDVESIRGQWSAFEKMKSDGLVDSLAVSNFSAEQLDAFLVNNPDAVSRPTVNQLPYSIAYHPKNMLEYNTQRDILVQSWSPLSRALPKYKSILASIGKKYGKSAAQVALRWIVQSGASFCMQSQKESHFKENLEVFDFSLSDQEMVQLTNLAYS
mmetsp:Transcript_30047/g.36661  ORF Transcript_30047/g.36661 Transcript_30047/m.36661 type:complete len:339 (+) Transcript_30047:120-1136(+)|eukprot:CAMPEP_0172505482 /NCGR_PEP_ID=MMETSP1066-20121228/186839_1 /TAXON_ID=671091 /ORGANISM="Coscinodiscus wailesii, Strain CCMP2513" /LENGTH=338 /DNA_ID=CAMNT_0013282099 /DNA_START=120 /DNA_END=1136 /DNA_ORIENTATION=+